MHKEGLAMKMALLGLLLATALAGCQATPYQPAADAGGFAELELIDGIWRIRFMGNAYTTRETARSYWLYRAAELTISKGYDGFEVLPQIGLARSQGSALIIEGEIRMLKTPFEFVPPRTFDAKSLKAALDPYVNGAKCDTRTTYGNICPHAHDYLLAKSGPKPAFSRAETPPSRSDELKLKMSHSIPCDGSSSPPGQGDCRREPAAAPVVKPKPAPAVARTQAPPVTGAESPLKRTGPCEVKPVMTDQDLVNCGARPR
jgi:hypothetical protein